MESLESEREAALLGKVKENQKRYIRQLTESKLAQSKLLEQLTEAQQLAADRLVQMEQYKVDALRYRWLKVGSDDWQICYWDEDMEEFNGVTFKERKNIDAAIDQAMQEAKP